ncbi:GH3 auxin-responsive promoter family protein [Archangium violaceum]|uniref:GH3 auxin-responsive promoter family protein n=1 Tax=Archangium violaceum TaxID=83451 RepID=UPI00193C1427|nr:GH3 auxin-responsive promoter family protein [Archangium violaceum]QRK10381.1 GH3 auxin-responsive promoter family protein [Archangium violaceum]
MLTARRMLSGLMAAQAPSALLFHRALTRPEQAQSECLSRILRATRDTTQSTRTPGFSLIRTAREFQDAVPISTPDSVLEDLEALEAGTPRVLTREPVVRFEPSGGSSGASKYVPVTRGLLDEFHRALAPMLFDLLHSRPAVREGPSYWSISPIGRKQGRTAGGIPVGSVEDSAYFPRFLQPLLSRVFAVPGAVAHLPDVESCRYVTLWFLVACEDLALLSVWNPSFLTLLMEALERHGERLAEDLERGVCRPPRGLGGQDGDAYPHPGPLPEGEGVLSRMRFMPRPGRARLLREVLRSGFQARALWPRLALLSMWTDAQAAHSVAPACRRFPGVEVQGKGLLATEGVVTLPLFGAPSPVLAVRSHFFEFLDPEHPGLRPRLAHELEVGRTYSVLLSTSGGLLRYRIGDLVRVEGFHHATPCLRFMGRADSVSDLVGEKLAATRVSTVLESLLPGVLGGQRPAFAMVAPEWEPLAPPAYRLFLETDASDARLEEAAHALDRALREGFHYRYARELGQLGPVRAIRVTEGTRRYEARCIALGQRAGDIKPTDLHRQAGWTAWFSQRGTKHP